MILLGGNDVSDVKRGIEVRALKELDRTFGDVYANEAGGSNILSCNIPPAPAMTF
ncbi:hypothetical protein [Escherichia coli]|uniref:hypothetical protein n=1 Tax=Escherichia coli TaxID=562 RepID=UPI00398609C8